MNKIQDLQEWLVIVNPNAGNGKGRKDWMKISSILKRSGINYKELFTERKGHAIELSKEGIEAGYRKFLCVGGDGTLNEIVNGVFDHDLCSTKDVTLGLVPVGTGNDWGRMFGIPLDYEGAIKIIKEAKLMLHDIGVVSYYNGNEKGKRYFINIAGLGFESVVVKRTNAQKDKGRSGKAIYFYNLLMSLLSYKNTNAEIIIDGTKIYAKIFSINVGNGRYCGGGMRQTPNAIPDDGILDVTVIKEMGRLEIIMNLNLLYNGTILDHPKIDGYTCKNVKISSEMKLFAEADGEYLGHTPAEFNIFPSVINIVYGTRVIQ
jgi:YegS/Rv2252/BmrU family lipid kinase